MHRCLVTALISLFLTAWARLAGAEDLGRTGTFLAVEGTVMMQPATLTPPRKVQPYDEVGPLAIVETKPASRVKVLFEDDTLVTLGENSRLEMTEQTYQPGSDSRVFVAHLTRGKARVVVGRSFKGDNSTFEVHSKTALVSARGTYFVTWIEEPPKRPQIPDRKGGVRAPPADESPEDYEGATGVANIGTSGDVTFTSGGATVLVLPGQSSIAMPGFPPSDPVSTDARGIGGGPVTAALAATALADVPRAESPRAALASVGIGGGTASLPSPVSAMAAPPGGQFASGAYAVPGWPLPVTPVTPPAVVSGAAGSTIRFTITLP